MGVLKIVGSVVAVLFGIFMVVYGEADDSPGGQFLGLVVAIAGIVLLVRKGIYSSKSVAVLEKK